MREERESMHGMAVHGFNAAATSLEKPLRTPAAIPSLSQTTAKPLPLVLG